MSNPFKRLRQLESSAYDNELLFGNAAKDKEPKFVHKDQNSPQKPQQDLKSIEQSYRQNQHYDRLQHQAKTQFGSNDQPPFQQKSTEEQYFDLGYKKRVQVRKYQGAVFIDIREYFQRDFQPDLLPTKKGVCLTPEIWQTLLAKSQEISECINKFQKVVSCESTPQKELTPTGAANNGKGGDSTGDEEQWIEGKPQKRLKKTSEVQKNVVEKAGNDPLEQQD